MPASSLAQSAEDYAKSGWYIFPLKPRDKTPLTAHGLKDATNKIDVIKQWWSKTPTANIGLNCGKSGLVVVDLDKRGEYDGCAEWAELSKQFGPVSTSTSLTGGGGRHLLFKSPEGAAIKNSAGKLAHAIDIRAEGGYIVLPPSIHPSGNPYQWADSNTDIIPLPDAVIKILTREPDPWQIFTLRDAFAPRPPLEWIVDGVIQAGSLTIWYGAPGSLKSMLLADMALSVAAGKVWLNRANDINSGKVVTPCPVMWLDFDNGQRRTHERMSALGKARGVSDSVPLYYASMPAPRLVAGETESMRALAVRLIDRDIRLVIIDNLGVIAGDVEENSADMQQPMAGLRWLAETGIAVVVIHHQRKTSAVSGARQGETLRGHSCIEAAIDAALLVTRDESTVTVNATKVRGPSIKQFSGSFVFENDAASELSTARFWGTNQEEQEEQDTAAMEASILEELRKFGDMSANAIYDRVGGNRSETLDLLRKMRQQKKLGERKNTRGIVLFPL